MSGRHTPGPWRYEPRNRRQIIAANGNFIGQVYPGTCSAAHGRLFAAAPDLLEALISTRKRLYDAMIALGSPPEFADAGCHEADAAIAKARGQA